MSEARKYRKFTATQKLELVVASLRGDRSVAEICREHQISETLLRRWREQLLDAGAERLAGAQERSAQAELRKKIAGGHRLERKTSHLAANSAAPVPSRRPLHACFRRETDATLMP